MPTLKGTEASLSYVQCFLYFLSSSKNVFIFHITCLETFWTDLVKLKATNELTRQTNKNSQTQTTVWWLPEEKGGQGEVVKGKEGQIYDDRRFDFRW